MTIIDILSIGVSLLACAFALYTYLENRKMRARARTSNEHWAKTVMKEHEDMMKQQQQHKDRDKNA